MEKINNQEEKIIEELRFLRAQAYDRGTMDFHERVIVKADILQEKYPNFLDYKLHHLLIGSTFSGDLKEFDFPGDDSVELFFRSLGL